MIAAMRKLTLTGLETDRGQILDALSWCGCCEVLHTYPFDGTSERKPGASASELSEKLAKLSSVIRFCESERLEFEAANPKKAKDKPLFASRKEKTYREFRKLAARESEALAQSEEIAKLALDRSRLSAEIAQKRAVAESLEPYAEFLEPLSVLNGTAETEFLLGIVYLRQESREALIRELSDCAVEILRPLEEGVCRVPVFLAFPRGSAEVRTKLAEYRFSPCPSGLSEPPAKLILDCRRSALEGDGALRGIAEQASKQDLNLLKDVFDYLSAELEREQKTDKFRYTGTAFVLNAWVPENAIPLVVEAVEKVSPECSLEFSLPEESDAPPTLAVNKKLVAPFEAVTNMYSVPSPYEKDPNLFVMIFFLIFFGIMLSDAGYGLILAAGAFLLLKFAKPETGMKKMIFVFGLGGLSTVVWGTLFGGWFGIELSPDSPSAAIRFLHRLKWFGPLEEPLLMLGLCMGLGVVQILTGMGIRFAGLVKEGKLWGALCDVGSWYLFFVGLGLFALSAFPALSPLRIWGLEGMGFALLALILTQGRAQKGILKKLGKGLTSLYGLVGYLSDILSYARLFGLGLATGVIALVMNTLAAMLFQNPWTAVFGIVIAAGGHLFNLAINVLGSYVHDCRLQYIEFFTRFYTGGGRVFKPLLSDLKYNVIK